MIKIVDEHDRGLPARDRGAHPLGVLGRGDLLLELGGDRVGQRLARRDQHRRGVHVVLGLRDQVRGHEPGIRAVVGQHHDLGRTGLGVGADDSLDDPLGRSHVDVARAR